MTQQYNAAGLERLYQAIKEQAEQEFLQALRRDNPGMSEQEEAFHLNFYREMERRAELAIIAQSRGNEG